jgi:hypothetical protein
MFLYLVDVTYVINFYTFPLVCVCVCVYIYIYIAHLRYIYIYIYISLICDKSATTQNL